MLKNPHVKGFYIVVYSKDPGVWGPYHAEFTSNNVNEASRVEDMTQLDMMRYHLHVEEIQDLVSREILVLGVERLEVGVGACQ